MTDDSSNARWAQSRHKHFPNRVCVAHEMFYGEPLCTNLRGRGLKVCKDHAEAIAERIGWMPQATWDAEQAAARRALKEDLEDHRRQLREAVEDNQALRAEIFRLKNLTPAQRRREERPTEGTVYALLSGYNVKIGWTSRDLPERLAEYPPNCTVLTAYPAKRGEETRLKRRFAHLRTHGNEWFPYAPQVTEWVEQSVAQHGAPDPAWTCGPAKATVPRPHADRPTIRPRGWTGKTA